jgi:hypothetical protein
MLLVVALAACGDSSGDAAQSAEQPAAAAPSGATATIAPPASQPESPLPAFDSPLAAPVSPLDAPQIAGGCALDLPEPAAGKAIVCGSAISKTPVTKFLLTGDFYLAPVIYSKAKLEDGTEMDIPFISLNVGSDKLADIKTESGDFVFLDVPPGEYGVVIYTPVQSFLFHDGTGQNTLMFEVAAGEVKQLDPLSLE